MSRLVLVFVMSPQPLQDSGPWTGTCSGLQHNKVRGEGRKGKDMYMGADRTNIDLRHHEVVDDN